MARLIDQEYGRTEPPDVFAPDLPEDCPDCGEWLETLEADGTCPHCGAHLEP